MGELIIDENFGGLGKDTNGRYVYRGSILTEGKLEIKVPLVVNGSIEAESIFAGNILTVNKELKVDKYLHVENLTVGGWVDVGGTVDIKGKFTVGGPIDVNGSLTVGEYLDVDGWVKVGGTVDVGKFKRIMGVETNKCILISSLFYTTILENHIKIGCEFHSREEWGNFTCRELLGMGRKKEVRWFLENKHWLLKVGVK